MGYTPLQATAGMNTDNLDGNIPQGFLTFANNAVITSFDRSYVSYSTEQGNDFCVKPPEGYNVIGKYNITEQNRVILFLVNPTTNTSQIGQLKNCTYSPIITAECLGFNIDYPIHQIVIKTTNCSTELYWTDNLSNMRYINLDDLPFREVPDPNNDYKKIKIDGEVDCNKMLIQSNFSIPQTNIISTEQGGVLKEGAYQFGVAYSNELGETYSPFFNVTNIISIKEIDRATQNFDTQTDQAIRVKVENLDTSGVFDYFVLIVAETINAITTFKRVGVYPIANESYDTLYTGDSDTAIQITAEQLFQQFQYYDLAQGVTQSDERVIFYGVKEKQKINYQPIWSKVILNWETHKLPYTQTEAYINPINTLELKGYMRDEVYPFEGAFILTNGKTTESFHIPGRLPIDTDLIDVPLDNLDSNVTETNCETPTSKKYWQVYNTGTVTGFSDEFQGNETDLCYKGSYQYGEFSYWESGETYPNNESIWGSLANKPIRHHKFPDELVTKRFTTDGDTSFVYPIGVKINIGSLRAAIENSDLTQEQKDEIVGFKIIRGKREAGNQSIKAKGYMTNVGSYEYEDQKYYFPNYPYNSLDIDPLYADNTKIKQGTGFNFDKVRKPYQDNQGKDQFTFHSPDTHFGRQAAIDQGYLKIEAIDYGTGKGHFVPIKNNAEYKFLTQDAIKASVVLASGVAFDFDKGGHPQFNGTDAVSVYSNTQALFEKLIAYQNFGYMIDSQATFNQSFAVPNEGNKIRGIEYGKYLRGGGVESIENGLPLNNYLRESSVYLKTNAELLYATEYSSIIPDDNSRIIATIDSNIEITPEEFFNTLKNEMTVATMTALILGMRTAAKEILPDNENSTTILTQMIGLILDPIISGQPFSVLQALSNQSNNCNDVAGIYPTYNINYSASNTALNTPYTQVPTPQNIDVYASSGELLSGGNPAPTFTINNNVPTITSNQQFTINYMVDTLNLTLDQEAQITATDPAVRSIIAAGLFGTTTANICGGRLLEAAYNAVVYGAQAYKTTQPEATKKTLSNFREFDVNAYYTSLKSYLPSQWGRMYSYTTVDTGYYQNFGDEPKTIFGGDTFINKFTLKTKLSVFNKTTIGLPDGADIALNEEGNLGDPMFYISTKPITYNYQLDDAALNEAFQGIGLIDKNALYGNLAQQIGAGILAAGLGITATGALAIPGLIVTAVGGIVYIIGSILKNIGNKITKAIIKLYRDLFQQLMDTIGVKNINLDMATQTGIAHQGIFYQYVFGLPTFFVESQVNVDYRQATNDNEGNFYPRVGEGVPDDWLQPQRVPLEYDNSYVYNKSYSKQNEESFFSHLREDFDPSKLCFSEFPNRAIWSEKTNLSETLNNWLIFKPISRFDFPKSYGKLTSLDGISNGVVMARFENKTQLYNALTTVNTSTFQAYLGNDTLFQAKPLDFSETDGGSLGSQHKFLLRTENGNIFVDSLRGQVVLYRGEQPQIISDLGMNRWFSENLPFNISKSFPDVNTDNNFKAIGIHGVYDQEYNRVILTKLDYQPIAEGIQFNNNKFYSDGKEIQLTDSKYFCNKSWTMSFSFLSNSWISYHSYLPNYYIGYPNTFQSGNSTGIYTHNTNYTTFHTYYGKAEPYILEYPLTYSTPQDQVIQSIRDYSTALIYQSKDISYEPTDILYFDKAELFNKNQHTGTRNLIPKPKNDLSALRKYPKYNSDSIDILVDKRDSWISFNSLWDIVQDANKPIMDISCSSNLMEADQTNLDYTRRPYKNILLRSKNARIRLTLNKNNFKLTSRLVLAQSTESNA